MLRKRYYILFVARDEDGRVRKIPLPLHYVYGFVAAALVGAFTIVGLAGSYTRMLLKTESYNQVRQERETLRKNYKQMAQIAHDRDVQVASLGALASEVTALYGLRQNKLLPPSPHPQPCHCAHAAEPCSRCDDVNAAAQSHSPSISSMLCASRRMSGRVTRALEGGLTPSYTGDWTQLADAPRSGRSKAASPRASASAKTPSMAKAPSTPASISMRPMARRCAPPAMAMWPALRWVLVTAARLLLDHGHDLRTVYGHLRQSPFCPDSMSRAGQVIGYVGQSGRATGPHLHYEVRVHNVPVNPHKYLRTTYEQADMGSSSTASPASKHQQSGLR